MAFQSPRSFREGRYRRRETCPTRHRTRMTGLTFVTVSLRVSPQLVVGQVVRVLSKECGDDGTSSAPTRNADTIYSGAMAVRPADVWRHCFRRFEPAFELPSPRTASAIRVGLTPVIHANGARRFRDGIDTGAGMLSEPATSILLCPSALRTPVGLYTGKVLLGQARHHTTRVGQGHSNLHVVTDGESHPTHSFSTNPRSGVSTITVIRNRRASKRGFAGWNSLSSRIQ